ncbi:MAG: CPBP family intramembrane metalloprotease [Planctomycetota bacterium]|nr:MAG: CPBP family intramembrane metalloprotease [Planctomycetota bacterium]
MRRCSYCGGPLADSARFCPACGQELPGYADAFRRPARPRPLGFLDRVPIQGGPAVRMLGAIGAVLVASTGLWTAFGRAGFGLLAADLLLALGVGLSAWPERERLRPLLRPPRVGWLVAALAGAAVLPLLGGIWVELLPGEAPGLEPPLAGLPPSLLAFSLCLIPGVCEEIAFRGVVLQTLLGMARPATAHLITAGLFAAVHLQPAMFPYHFLVGLFLGWLRIRSRSLGAPMLAHAGHNAIVLLLLSGR